MIHTKTIQLNLLLGFFFLISGTALSQNHYMSSPEGFGAAATGGGNVTPVIVTNFTELKAALPSTSSNKVILIKGVIDCTYWSVLMTNVSIIGLPGAKLRNLQITVTATPPTAADCITSSANSGILYIKPNSKNVIIRNLIFEGPGAFDVDGRDNLTNEGTDVWVDHCEFQDGMDGNFDNKGACDNTSISWCKFTYKKPAIAGGSGGSADHRFSDLIGSSATDFPTDGHYSITFKNCYWAEGCKSRMPRARNAEIHLLNCYYNTSVSGALSIGLGGGSKNTTCYVENTDFAKIAKVYDITSYLSDGGSIGLAFSGCLNRSDLATGTLAVPKPTYSYSVLPVADVASYLTDATCGAGATLQVSETGEISQTVCTNLTTPEVSESEVPFRALINKNTLNITFSDSSVDNLKVSIYALSGEKVFSYSIESLNPAKNLDINIENLANGVYIAKVNYNNKSGNWKFIKN